MVRSSLFLEPGVIQICRCWPVVVWILSLRLSSWVCGQTRLNSKSLIRTLVLSTVKGSVNYVLREDIQAYWPLCLLLQVGWKLNLTVKKWYMFYRSACAHINQSQGLGMPSYWKQKNYLFFFHLPCPLK